MWEIQKTESKLKRESEENLMKRLFTMAGTKLKETTGDILKNANFYKN